MERESYVDGLRGIAALVVFCSHFLCAFYPATDTLSASDIRLTPAEITCTQTPLNIFYNGNFAVCLFFVISGYALSYSFFKTRDGSVLYSAAFRRYFRLMIPVGITSLLYLLVLYNGWFVSKKVPALSSSPWLQKMWNTEPDILHFLQSTFYDIVMHPETEPPYNPALWSIGIELKGSYLVYVFLGVLGKSRFRWPAYVLVALWLHASYYVLFVAGMFLGDLKQLGKMHRQPSLVILLLFGFGCYTGSYKLVPTGSMWSIMDSWLGIVRPQVIGAILLFYTCLESVMLKKWLSGIIPQSLGKISYSLYLLHLLVIGSFAGWAFNMVYSTGYIHYGSATLIVFMLSFIVSYGLSLICTRWVDDPGVVFSKWVYAKFDALIRSIRY